MNEPNEVVLTPCDSSFISGYAYNDSVWVFTIQFRNGPTKAYQEVEPEVYEDFLSAESKGRWFKTAMQHKYESMVITEGVTVAPVSAETTFETEVVEMPPSKKKIITESLHPVDDEPDPTVSVEIAVIPSEAHGENLPPLEPPTTINDALKMLNENAGLIAATVEQNGRIAKTATTIKVTDAASYERAGTELRFLTEVKDRSMRFLDPIRALLLKPYQVAQQRLKEAVEPLDGAVTYLKRQRLDWSAVQERIRAERQRAAQAEADRKAEEERQKAGVQLTWNEIGNALEQGDEAKAAELVESPINVPGVYQPPVHVESEVPRTAGVSRRTKWAIEVTDFEDMILSVAEGICSTRDGKGLKGHAPVNFLKANETAIKDAAKSQQKSFQYPGIRAWDEGSEAIRRKK